MVDEKIAQQNYPQDVPTAITDFATAIQAICNSQADVNELVTKWSQIMSSSPMEVEIRLSNGTTTVIKNVAMVENELQKSVKETYPNINQSRAVFRGSNVSSTGSLIMGASAEYSGMGSHGQCKYVSDGSDTTQRSLTPLIGWTQSTVNDFVSYRAINTATKNSHTIDFVNLPRLVMVGLPHKFNDVDNNETTITVRPIGTNNTQFNLDFNTDDGENVIYSYTMGYYYACVTRFINHSTASDFTVHLKSSTEGNSVNIKIPMRSAALGPLSYADVLFTSGKGTDSVNFELLNGGGASYV